MYLRECAPLNDPDRDTSHGKPVSRFGLQLKEKQQGTGCSGLEPMKTEIKSGLKWLYYTLRSELGEKLIPRHYNCEYRFFERLRRESYHDLSFQEAKLRSCAHQIDKALVFDKIRKRDVSCRQIADLIDKISKSPGHDIAIVRWAKNVLAEYESRLAGGPQLRDAAKAFDEEGQALLADVIKSRRSIRSFQPDQIDKGLLRKLLQAGLWAPTGCNRQPIEYLVLQAKEDIKYCQRLAGEGYPFPAEAPLAVVVMVDPRNYALPSQRHMAFLETGAASQNIILTAFSYGIGSCWLFWSDTKNGHAAFSKRFGLKSWLLPTAMVCLGYPKNCPKLVPTRKDLERVIHWASVHGDGDSLVLHDYE